MKIILATLALATASLSAQQPVKVQASNLLPGDSIPTIQGVTLDGKPFNLSKDLKGKVVLVDFWATWCGPCVAETPNIVKSYKKWQDKGFKVVTISLDTDPAKAKAYLDKKNLDWFNIADCLGFKSPLAKNFSISGIPQIMLIGRDGRVYANGLRGADIGATIDRAMSGTGIVSTEKAAVATLPKDTKVLLNTLDQQLASGTEEQSLGTMKLILNLKSLPYDELERIAVKYGCRIDGKFHAQTVYLAADAVLSTGTITSKNARLAGAARAHAAIELGGPYLVEKAINLIKMLNRGNTPEITKLLIHRAIKTGDSEQAIEAIFSDARRGKMTFAEIETYLSQIKANESSKRAILDHWLEQQRDQPADRVSITPTNGKFEVRYNVSQSVFKGSLQLNAMLIYANGGSIVLPMTFSKEKGWHITLDAPIKGTKTKIYFTNNAASNDDNAGKFWWIQ